MPEENSHMIGRAADGKTRQIAVDDLGRIQVVVTDTSTVVTSITSADVNAVSIQAASADAALSVRIDGVSSGGGGGGTASMTSNEVSILVQGASAAATSANAHANAVSVRAVSISAELVSLMNSADAALSARITSAEAVIPTTSVTSAKVQTASAAATSAIAKAVSDNASLSAVLATSIQTASAAASVADAHANTVSVRVVSVSAELASLLASVEHRLSGRIDLGGGTASVTSNKLSASVQIASAAATSADIHANTVSARLVSASAELGSLIQVASLAATSADAHANTVSLRAVSISAELVSLMNSADAALSTRINTASALGTTADTHANTVSIRAVSISNELGSLLASASLALETHANTASLAATSADAHANTVSVRLVSVSAELASLLASASANLASIRTASVQVASAAATSADAHANTVSIAAAAADTHANTVSVRAVSISAELASLVQIASLAATSADTHANTVSVRAVSISAELASLVQIASAAATSVNSRLDAVSCASGAGFAVGLQSVVNALSNRISAGGGGAASVTSTELSAARYIPNTTQTNVDYTLVLADALTLIQMSSSSAHNLTVPPNSSVAFPVGTQIVVEQAGTASVTIVAGAGVTLQGVALVTVGQYSTVVLIKQATDTWLVSNANASIASAAFTSLIGAADAHASVASLAATSADAHAQAVSVRAVSISAELASLITSAAPRKAVNTANQVSITVSTCSTVSGVSLIVSAGVTYTFEFQIPFTCLLPSGMTVGVVGPACTTFNAQYQIPGATGATGIAPAANAVAPFYAQVRAIGTKVSTTSITLTATTLVAYAWGTINPSATGSLKFVIGTTVSGGTNSGIVVLVGANILVNRISG